MISVCSSVYKETTSLEIFVRSILQQASDPEDVEIIIVNDGGYEPTTRVLERLSKEFPQLKFLIRTKAARCEFIRKQIEFYEKKKIFDSKVIADMFKTVNSYERGLIKDLWFPPGELFNLAVSESKGDVLLISPADYLCTFNISILYRRYLGVKKKEKSFVGHLDWVDFTSLDPMPNIYQFFRQEKDRDVIKGFIQGCLNQIDINGLTLIRGQHGARIIDRDSFEKVGGFDGRWFARAWNDDCFNEKIKKIISPTYRLMDRMQFVNTSAYVGRLRGKSEAPLTYLTKFYSPVPEIHARFLDPIKTYLEKEVNI